MIAFKVSMCHPPQKFFDLACLCDQNIDFEGLL